MKKIFAIVAVAGLLSVGASVPAQAETAERAVTVVEAPAVPVSVPETAEAPTLHLEAVRAVAAPVQAPESVPVPVIVEAPAVAVAAPVAPADVNPAELGYVQAVPEEEPVAFEVPVEVPAEEGDPVTYGPEVNYVQARDGSWVPDFELEAYEAWVDAGGEVAVGFTEPVEVPAEEGDPVTYNPGETVYVEAKDGSMVPESELESYEAWLDAGNQAPTVCG